MSTAGPGGSSKPRAAAKFSIAEGLQKQKPSGGLAVASGALSDASSWARLPGASVEYTACACTRRRCESVAIAAWCSGCRSAASLVG